MSAKTLTVQQRRSIFHALVIRQDEGGVTVSESKKQVAEQFHITRELLDRIEEEGVDKEWPPLTEVEA